jgi:hypothetical protein
MLAEGSTLDEACGKLRSQGVSPIDCIIAIREYTHCDLGEAKRRFAMLKSWQDITEATEKMWDNLENEMTEPSHPANPRTAGG